MADDMSVHDAFYEEMSETRWDAMRRVVGVYKDRGFQYSELLDEEAAVDGVVLRRWDETVFEEGADPADAVMWTLVHTGKLSLAGEIAPVYAREEVDEKVDAVFLYGEGSGVDDVYDECWLRYDRHRNGDGVAKAVFEEMDAWYDAVRSRLAEELSGGWPVE